MKIKQAAEAYIDAQIATEQDLILEDFTEGLHIDSVEEAVRALLSDYYFYLPRRNGFIIEVLVDTAYLTAYMLYQQQGMSLDIAFIGSADYRHLGNEMLHEVNITNVMAMFFRREITHPYKDDEAQLYKNLKEFGKVSTKFLDRLFNF